MSPNPHKLPAPGPRRQWLRTSLGLGAALTGLGAAPGRAAASPLVWRERALLGFGTTLWVRAAQHDGNTVERALDAAVQAIRHVEAQMSLFDPSSAVSRLNRDGELREPDAHLLRVLQLARQVAARSDGAFDITVQPLWLAWEAARRLGRTPTRHELSAARALVGWRGVEADAAHVRLRRSRRHAGRPPPASTAGRPGRGRGVPTRRCRAARVRYRAPPAARAQGRRRNPGRCRSA